MLLLGCVGANLAAGARGVDRLSVPGALLLDDGALPGRAHWVFTPPRVSTVLEVVGGSDLQKPYSATYTGTGSRTVGWKQQRFVVAGAGHDWVYRGSGTG